MLRFFCTGRGSTRLAVCEAGVGVHCLWGCATHCVRRLAGTDQTSSSSGASPAQRQLPLPPAPFRYMDDVSPGTVAIRADDIHGASVFARIEGASTQHSSNGLSHRRTKGTNALEVARPVEFEVFIDTARSGLEMHVLCSSLAGLLSVDGVSFSGAQTSQGRSGKHLPLRPDELRYSGPYLNQRHLAESVCSVQWARNPLLPHPHEHALFFSSRVNSSVDPFSRFSHSPVHTVPHALNEALVRMLSHYRVDDELSAFVEQCAPIAHSQQQRAWREAVHKLFQTGFTPSSR